MYNDFFAGITMMLIVFALFLFGYGCKKADLESDIVKQKAIYIREVEYRCSEVKR